VAGKKRGYPIRKLVVEENFRVLVKVKDYISAFLELQNPILLHIQHVSIFAS
jgi:hypothetical protein